MDYKIINCDSLLKKITRKDDLFNGQYCIDPYQNCEFGCNYCDSSFEKTIYVKKNAGIILENEIQSIQKGVIIVGSVHDPYQKAEKIYEITKQILKIIKKYDFPCHILTKSNLILRDIDILSTMNCFVTISVLSLDKNISRIFEKNVPSTIDRLNVLKTLSENNIKTGIALIPILPYITTEEIENIIQNVKKNNAKHFLHRYLELKGEQKQILFDELKNHYPTYLSKYNKIYENNIKPDEKYSYIIDKKVQSLCKKYEIADKIIR